MTFQYRHLLNATLALTLFAVGCGEDDDTMGPGQEPVAVGAASTSMDDDRVVLVNLAGTRFVYMDPADGSFTSSRPVSEIEQDYPLTGVNAAVHGPESDPVHSYYFDVTGSQMAYLDHEASSPAFDVHTFGDTAFDAAPFDQVGAAFVSGETLFFFNRSGSCYTAFDTDVERWSPVYSFAGDFGGGGAPIAAVGAAYKQPSGEFVLFNLQGDKFTYYTGGGNFSPAFDISELGDGSLAF